MGENDQLSKMIATIPTSYAPKPEMRCCCGSIDCVYLQQNCAALEQLEREVRTAAQLGQALLERYEHHIQHAEQERREMTAKGETLESEKKGLQEHNTKIQQTNRELFDQLEELNLTIVQSEARIKALESTLDSTRYEFRRLQTMAARTSELENQLAALEQEQDILRNTIWTTQEQERAAWHRWRTAERRLTELHEQLESIDRERKEEKDRHAEVISRMRRQRTVEKVVDKAAKRWKETAAISSLVGGRNGSDVVSSFVKQVLQDNGNLQSEISELRGMLSSSNDEVQSLREQLIQHQPLYEREFDNDALTLNTELAQRIKTDSPIIAHHLRIHHHYHSPSVVDRSRRHRRKRSSLDRGLSTPLKPLKLRNRKHNVDCATLGSPMVSCGPSTPISRRRGSEQTGSHPELTPSSVTSSTPSRYGRNTIFDKGFDFHSSNPTSPGSSVGCPSMFDSHKLASEASRRRSSTPFTSFHEGVIYEDLLECESFRKLPEIEQPKLRHFVPHPRLRSTTTSYSQNTMTCPSLVTALPTMAGRDISSKLYLRSNVLARKINSSSNQTPEASVRAAYNSKVIRSSKNFRSWMRENCRFKLGRTEKSKNLPCDPNEEPSPTDAVAEADAQVEAEAANESQDANTKALVLFKRPHGINQKGSVPGFVKKSVRLPCQILPVDVDYDSLREVLEDDLCTFQIG